jgi:23S rRNA (pseudouridine1915-N3)-methyltransferase
MRISLICVGRLSSEYRPLWRHYEGLLRPYCDVEVFEVSEWPLRRGKDQARAKESAALRDLLRERADTLVLDPRGREFTSEGLSRHLAERKAAGQSQFQFVIGGPAGLVLELLERADVVWALSRLTLPHQMVRCILVEQLYRAFRIERGEPYHH